jgi:hypothetical protein
MKECAIIFVATVTFGCLVTFSLVRTRQWSEAQAEAGRQAQVAGAERQRLAREAEAERRRQDQAVEAAKARITRALSCPPTAQWPDEFTVSKYNGVYVVRGYVDASNGRGGMVRRYFTALAAGDTCFAVEQHDGYDSFTAYKLPGE